MGILTRNRLAFLTLATVAAFMSACDQAAVNGPNVTPPTVTPAFDHTADQRPSDFTLCTSGAGATFDWTATGGTVYGTNTALAPASGTVTVAANDCALNLQTAWHGRIVTVTETSHDAGFNLLSITKLQIIDDAYGKLNPTGTNTQIASTLTNTNTVTGTIGQDQGYVVTFNYDGGPTTNEFQLELTKTADAPSTVSAGDQIGFRATVKNNGPGTATNVTLTDVLPTASGLSWTIDAGTSTAGCSITSGTLTCNFGSLAAGDSGTVHITSPTTAASCGEVTNTAHATADNTDELQASAHVDVDCPSVSFTKVADAASVNAGNPIGFVVTVSSNGPGTAKAVAVSDPLPGGVTWSIDGANSDTGCSITSGTLNCSFGDLVSGSSKHVHITAPTTNTSCATYNNTATVSGSNFDGGTASASVTVSTCFVGGETATGAGFPWSQTQGAPANWFMYSPWVTTGSYRGISAAASGSIPAGTDLIAGQIYIAGRITGTRGSGANSTSITITLNTGFKFDALSSNVMINPMSCTTAQPYVQPGKFAVKRSASTSASSITVTGLSNTACYGVHVAVQRAL